MQLVWTQAGNRWGAVLTRGCEVWLTPNHTTVEATLQALDGTVIRRTTYSDMAAAMNRESVRAQVWSRVLPPLPLKEQSPC